ncbi:Peptide methionine sulfoxide reductase MsrA [Thalassocella blandensis]|nr:Peptide methionine sulfoxide reductase MsrA [Thalassocella blandensis]
MFKNTKLPESEELLPGRNTPLAVSDCHYVSNRTIKAPFPEGTAQIMLGMGCFWGAERKLWQQEGVYTTAVGYAGGGTPNPTYEEVCSGYTGHSEVVLVVYENTDDYLSDLLKVFWESHDPTQGMRQGNDVGTQYRSAIYVFDEAQMEMAIASKQQYENLLKAEGFEAVSTEIKRNQTFYYAETYHQQYLAKNPHGYCGLGGTGVCLAESLKQEAN